MKRLAILFAFISAVCIILPTQAQNIRVHPQQVIGNAPALYKPGVFLVPKTVNGENDFLNNNIAHNAIRIISIETAFDFSSPSINDIMTTLELLKPGIMYANSRCDKLVLPIMKMPAWLSSSTDTTTIGGGWRKFNGMPPASYSTWNLLVDSIVSKINGQWGLDPYYEIWNEPDIFYWQGTTSQYFQFFRNTLGAIKTNHPTAKVGGPVVSSFTSKFGSTYLPGFITDTQLDTSIIGRVIDSCMAWNTRLDFISWHKFDSYLYPVQMEIAYLNQKLVNSGHGIVPYIVSEWNNTGGLRESNVAAAFMPNYVLALEQFQISGQLVAAWQDFEQGPAEFHQDYGLISWGALHKPEWKSLQLLNKMKGLKIQTDSSDYLNLAVVSAIESDTLRILFSNHSLPGYVEATSFLLYTNQFNALDLAVAGYTSARLDSIYQGLLVLTGTDSLSVAINAAIPVYQAAEAALQSGRNINLTIAGLQGTYTGLQYRIDSTANNVVHTYDSLLNAGHTRPSATALLYPNSLITPANTSITDSVYNVHMQPNSVLLLEFIIPGISAVPAIGQPPAGVSIYPNPTLEKITVQMQQLQQNGFIRIYNATGMLLKTIALKDAETVVDISDLPAGSYYLQTNGQQQLYKFIKIKRQ